MPGPVQPRTEFGYRDKFTRVETAGSGEPGSDHATVRIGIPAS